MVDIFLNDSNSPYQQNDKRNITENVNHALEKSTDSQSLIANDLIPAINQGGLLFEQKLYIFPPLIKMVKVTKFVKERQLPFQVIIGGVVITESYTKEIGADGYSRMQQRQSFW